MRSNILLYFFCAALITIQGCSKSDSTPKPQTTVNSIAASSGLKLNNVGDYGIYQFLNSNGDLTQVKDNSVNVGATYNTASASGSAFQKWKITRVSDTHYTIMNLGSKMYAQSYNNNGTQVLIQNKAANIDAQLWSLMPTAGKIYKAINKATGLSITDNAAGMTLIKTYTNLATQGW
ncbi:MAG: hypothetical protein EOP47_30335, partial [Sphingobacteriaceae bacterium]